MISFHSNRPIYLQIAEFIQNNVLQGKYKEGDKISSVREMAAEIGVNPNTIMRSFTYLQQNSIIKNRRGIGYFVTEGAAETIRQKWKSSFLEEEWPAILQKMELLDINLKDLEKITSSKINK